MLGELVGSFKTDEPASTGIPFVDGIRGVAPADESEPPAEDTAPTTDDTISPGEIPIPDLPVFSEIDPEPVSDVDIFDFDAPNDS
jgi:hypothetical protein